MTKNIKAYVVLKTRDGEVIISERCDSSSDKKLVLNNPIQIIANPTENGKANIEFIPWAPFCENEVDVSVEFISYSGIPTEELVDHYKKVTNPSSIITPENSGKIIKP